ALAQALGSEHGGSRRASQCPPWGPSRPCPPGLQSARPRARPYLRAIPHGVEGVVTALRMRSFIVGIAGATGSGKTTVAHRLMDAVAGDVALLQHDSYYRDRSHLPEAEREAL